MKKLLVLVLVAALCLPCYGGGGGDHNILVYKFTCHFNPYITTGVDVAIVGTRQVTGYLVFDIDLVNKKFNQDPYMISYGKDGTSKWATDFTLTVSTIEVSFNIYDIIEGPGKGHQCIYMNIDDDHYHMGLGSFLCRLYGKIGPVDIGFVPKVKKNVPSSLKGPVSGWAPPLFKAFGDMTATLDSKYTKLANKENYDEGDIVDIINGDLVNKGYIF